MTRYAQLLALIDQEKPRRIVEVGTWNGDRAIQMILHAQSHVENKEDIEYIGFDLFEEASEETDREESNVKPHHNQDDVGAKIAATGAQVQLIRGNTRKTLPDFTSGDWEAPDLAFIDGGHSLETIRSDYECLKDSKVIVFDDFYVEQGGKCIDTAKFGCNRLVEEIGASILSKIDPVFVDGEPCGGVQMAVWPPSVVKRQSVKIKTRNVGSDELIHANIKAALEADFPRWRATRPHSGICVFVSGGPSFEDHLEDIRRLQKSGGYVFCVKHAHDTLIEAGIVPWACVLLDPRGHVEGFVKEPHSDVRYFIASMCDPVIWGRMKGQKVWMYHAMVGAGEEALLKGEVLVGGGCSAAIRGITLAHGMGFRDFRLFGYDLCYSNEAEGRVRATIDKEILLDTEGEFWTDYEKLAQAQEFKQLMNMDIRIEAYGTGLVPALLNTRTPMPGLEVYG